MDPEDFTDPPTSIDPYAILEVPKSATEGEIKSAYKKLALKRHPDKAPTAERESAHKAFQELAFAYAVLSDSRRRARYDRTGNTADSLDIDDDDFDWVDFFRNQYKEVVTADKISELKRSYQGSEEEKRDVLAAYTKSKGDIDRVFENVLLSSVLDDEARLRGYIDVAIEAGEVEGYDKYVNESAKKMEQRRRKAEREQEEAEEAAMEMGVHDEIFQKGKKKGGENGSGAKKKAAKKKSAKNNDADLAAIIQSRQAAREGHVASFFDRLEAKYGPEDDDEKPKRKTKKRKGLDEPSEEAFAEMGRRTKKSSA